MAQVDPAASKHELLKSKTEIRLKKAGAIRWPTLEKSNEKADPYAPAPTAAAPPPRVQQHKPSYPSSANRKVVDWYSSLTPTMMVPPCTLLVAPCTNISVSNGRAKSHCWCISVWGHPRLNSPSTHAFVSMVAACFMHVTGTMG